MKPQGSLFASIALSTALMAGTASAADLAPMVSQLEAQGWTVIEEANGNRRLYPPGAAAAPAIEEPAPEPAETAPSKPTQEELVSALTAAGWQVELDDDGSRTIRPPSAAEATSGPRSSASGEGISVLNSTTVAILELESLGWRVDKSTDGSILLYPPADAAATAAEEPAADPEPTPEPTAPAMLDEATLDQMRALGWKVEFADDGSVLLYPPEQAAEPSEATEEPAQTEPANDEESAGTPATAEPAPDPQVTAESTEEAPAPAPPMTTVSAAADDAQFDILRNQGWTVERKADGSLYLFPPGNTATSSSAASDKVELPVDSWSEVHTLANAWLAETGKTGLDVGKIRNVFGVYIVSIIEAAAPHALVHQISVRTRDGAVIQLD